MKNGEQKHDKPLEDFELDPIYPRIFHFSPHNQNQYQTAYNPNYQPEIRKDESNSLNDSENQEYID